MPTNERLRAAIAATGRTVDSVARSIGVAPETLQRWVDDDGRVPYARNRETAAGVLGKEASYLWPAALSPARSVEVSRSELMTIYPRRAEVPAELWWSLFDQASDQIALVVYAAIFLFEQHPELVELLATKSADGCQVRLALGDPTSEAVRARGEEERYGEGIESRVHLALKYLEPLHAASGVEVRLHRTTLYNSIYRFDDQLLVNTHLWAVNAYGAPVLHLKRVPGGNLFDVYARNLETIWSVAAPVTW